MSRPKGVVLANEVALEVLCRVFDDGADKGYREWLDYDQTQWLWWGRALGGFIRQRLDRLGSTGLPPYTEGAPDPIRFDVLEGE